FTATDACGNTSTAARTVTWTVDASPPAITCPANITVDAAPGSCTSNVTFTVTATDNCGVISVTSVPVSGFAFPAGTTTITSTVTDACGNSSSCTFTVTVLHTNVSATALTSLTNCVGTTATFSTVASGSGPLSFVWRKNGGVLGGQTSNTLTLSNV